ncbi:MAG TPA: polysaccharide deacetylase, partial [Firmicutes bacterium]|nr:polysaccharide deacetylase [Bacillota bacterium]
NLSLPFGVFAKNPKLEISGSHEETKYRHSSIVLVGSGSVPSPFSKDFNPFRLERIQAGDTPWGPKAYVERYKKNPSLRYVSDGNARTITVPKGAETNIPAALAAKYRVLSVEPVSAG